MATYKMFRATDKRDNKREIFIIRNGVDVAVVRGSAEPVFIKRQAACGGLFYAPLDTVARHIGDDQELIQEWEFPE